MPQGRKRWSTSKVSFLNPENFQALLKNEIPAIRIPNFATKEECDKLIAALKETSFHQADWNPHTSQRFGPSYFTYRQQGKKAYFEKARQFEKLRNKIVAESFDPLSRFVQRIYKETGMRIEVAYEPGYGNYFAGAAKHRLDAPLHRDTSEMMKGWVIGKMTSQLSWNVYLNISTGLNSTVVYNKQWQKEDDRFLDGVDDYTDEVIEGIESICFRPLVGEVILFNSSNYHKVLPLEEVRYTMGCFFGETPEGKLIYWS